MHRMTSGVGFTVQQLITQSVSAQFMSLCANVLPAFRDATSVLALAPRCGGLNNPALVCNIPARLISQQRGGHAGGMRGDALKRAVDGAVSDRQAEAASRTARLRDAQKNAGAAEARLQTVRASDTTQAPTVHLSAYQWA